MSQRIEHILNILGRITRWYDDDADSITEFRRRATNEVAAECGIDERSVRDTYREQLDPPIRGVKQFDYHLKKWLTQDDLTIRGILLDYSDGVDESNRVAKFFDSINNKKR